ncbi:DUF397 domain-containing protein [Micromonospora zhanjiangensis]|uniref:DUF397 domain-containing protein n=1 Tax=Micromonospora zhanjiangensis TaxID=1522057 RepID=A0ABV8KUS5_9ACTN
MPDSFINTTHPTFTAWRKSTRSQGTGNCLYVSESDGSVAVADGKAGPAGPVQVFDRAAFAAFLHAVKSAAFRS